MSFSINHNSHHIEEDSSSCFQQKKDGLSLHQTVPMDSWCVTQEDLHQLRSAVREAVGKGDVVPTRLDAFDVRDLRFGPSVHTVVSQLIKPVTDLAGGQSWALMKHPKGLKCDVFVTHAWAEGIYEFIDKLLNSWPAGANHAYCCMLSNPQNLDIANLLSQPSSSPFALALKSATYMIVIPNRNVSIYSRVWCVYEAYLAYKWRKVIYVASFPIPYLRLRCIAFSVLFVVAMVAYLAWADQCPDDFAARNKFRQFEGCSKIITVFALLVPPCFALDLINVLGLVFEGIVCGIILRNINIVDPRFRVYLIEVVQTSVFFLGSVADRARLAEAAVERVCLRKGFTGKVCDAECSKETDRQQILAEICETNDANNVDHAISVLLRIGMYTKSIRTAIANGVVSEEAGHFRLSVLYGGFVNWFIQAIYSIFFEEDIKLIPRTLEVATAISAIFWLLIYIKSPRDERAFAANSIFKFVWILPNILSYVLLILVSQGLIQDDRSEYNSNTFCYSFYYEHVHHFLRFFAGTLALICSALGLGRVTTIPLVGRPLANVVLWQGECCCRCRSGQRQQVEATIELKLIKSRNCQDSVLEADYGLYSW